MTTGFSVVRGDGMKRERVGRRPFTPVALVVALVAALLPFALEVQQSGAAGPPAGCNLFDAFEPTFVGNSRVAFSAQEPVNGSTEADSPRSIYVSDLDGTDRAEISSVSGTPDPSNNRDPVGSNDGTKVAWDGIPGTGRAILVSGPDGSAQVNVSTGLTNANRHPRFSNDGTKVVWYNEQGGIYVANADGSGRVRIDLVGANPDPVGNRRPEFNHNGTRVAWSGVTSVDLTGSVDADGTTTVTGVGTTFVTDGVTAGDTLRLGGEQRVVASVGGETSLTVTEAFSDLANDTTPEVLRREIYVANADGTGRVAISAAAGLLWDNNYPDFNHDGTRVTWSGFDGVDYQIYAADSATGLNRVTVSTVASGNDPDNNTTPRYSPNGSRIVWIGEEATFGFANVWVANADGTARADVTKIAAPQDPSGNSAPAWSPDGTKLTWSGVGTNGIQIWVANANGTNRVEVSVVDDPALCDNTAPEITLVAPADGVRYALNQPVTANYTCADAQSGIASCVGSVANGSPINTSTRGVFSFTVTATNNAGAVAVRTHNYSVDTTAPTTTSTTTTTTLPAGQPDCPNNPTPFTDVPSGSFAAADIRCIWGLGIPTGTTPTTYSPANPVTREQMASFLARLWRAAGGGCPTAATPFTDISPTSFAATDVRCIYGLGFTTGTSAITYSPSGNVTREQMASFLARVWRGAGGTCSTAAAPFTDVSPSSFARNDINCIFALGITTGTTPTTYSPKDSVTREQMAAFLGRLYRGLDDLN